MKSLRLNPPGQTPPLIETDTPQPVPAPGQVLVRIRAAGITPSEVEWFPTWNTRDGEKRTGAIPAHEFSGEVAAIGASVEGVSPGDQVFGMNDWFDDGALAEYCLTRPEWIAPKPKSMTHAEAASVPIGTLTAWQGLFEHAKLQAGERVLVHGGAGAVGIFAIQIAHRHGAHVLTTVSACNLDFAKQLGADEAIDYKAAPFEQTARDIDVVFDAVGGETLNRSWAVLRGGGRLVTIAAGSATAEDRVKRAFFIVEPRRDELINIANLIDTGQLRTVVDAVLPMSQASEAFAGRVRRSGRGKLVVRLI